jgi:hypothetical protein
VRHLRPRLAQGGAVGIVEPDAMGKNAATVQQASTRIDVR